MWPNERSLLRFTRLSKVLAEPAPNTGILHITHAVTSPNTGDIMQTSLVRDLQATDDLSVQAQRLTTKQQKRAYCSRLHLTFPIRT